MNGLACNKKETGYPFGFPASIIGCIYFYLNVGSGSFLATIMQSLILQEIEN